MARTRIADGSPPDGARSTAGSHGRSSPTVQSPAERRSSRRARAEPTTVALQPLQAPERSPPPECGQRRDAPTSASHPRAPLARPAPCRRCARGDPRRPRRTPQGTGRGADGVGRDVVVLSPSTLRGRPCGVGRTCPAPATLQSRRPHAVALQGIRARRSAGRKRGMRVSRRSDASGRPKASNPRGQLGGFGSKR
jgi:hypothetical protein